MQRGRIMEPHIADMYRAATGRALVLLPSIRHPQNWWFRATPDRGIVSRGGSQLPHRDGTDDYGILEIKSLGRETFAQTRAEGVDPSYYAQLQWYLGIFGYSWGAFALHNLDSWALHHFDIEFDRPYFEFLWNTAQSFWDNFVLTRTRPNGSVGFITSIVAPETPRVGAEAVIVNTPEMTTALSVLRDMTEASNLMKVQLEQAQERVKQLCGDNELCVVPGVGRISYAESHRTSFDKDQLYRDYPELIGRYERRTATRVFRPTFDNGQTTRRRR